MTAHSLREQPRGTGEFSWIQEPVSTTAQSMRYDKRLGLYGEQDPTDLKCDWKTGWSNTGWWYTLDALQDVDKVSPGTVVPSTLPPPARLLYGMYVYMCRYIRYLMYRVTCVKLAAHSVSRTFLQTTGMYNECSASWLQFAAWSRPETAESVYMEDETVPPVKDVKVSSSLHV